MREGEGCDSQSYREGEGNEGNVTRSRGWGMDMIVIVCCRGGKGEGMRDDVMDTTIEREERKEIWSMYDVKG